MHDLTLPTLNEVIAMIISVILGTSAYLGFMITYKKMEIVKWKVLLVFIMNLFVTFVASEAMKLWNFGSYRTVFLPLIAYAGQYLMEWFDKRYLKIFDSGAGKIGIDTHDKINDNENKEPTN